MEQKESTIGSNTRAILEMRVRIPCTVSGVWIWNSVYRAYQQAGWTEPRLLPARSSGHAKTGSLKSHEFNGE